MPPLFDNSQSLSCHSWHYICHNEKVITKKWSICLDCLKSWQNAFRLNLFRGGFILRLWTVLARFLRQRVCSESAMQCGSCLPPSLSIQIFAPVNEQETKVHPLQGAHLNCGTCPWRDHSVVSHAGGQIFSHNIWTWNNKWSLKNI